VPTGDCTGANLFQIDLSGYNMGPRPGSVGGFSQRNDAAQLLIFDPDGTFVASNATYNRYVNASLWGNSLITFFSNGTVGSVYLRVTSTDAGGTSRIQQVGIALDSSLPSVDSATFASGASVLSNSGLLNAAGAAGPFFVTLRVRNVAAGDALFAGVAINTGTTNASEAWPPPLGSGVSPFASPALRFGRVRTDAATLIDPNGDRYCVEVIDIDENPILTKAYGIDSIPTLLLISDDKVIDRSAYFGRKTFGDMLKKLER
jgi:hypothetical protein